jgi:hypothetical protein
MADSTLTTTSTADSDSDPWATAMVEWHCAAIDLANARAEGRNDEDADRKMNAATSREDAAASAIFATPAPGLPALLHKIAIYRALYTSTGNSFPPEDHRDLVALASIEADVASIVCRKGRGQ